MIPPRLVIRPHIRLKLAGKQPPVTPEEAIEIFDLYFDQAEEHPDDPNDPAPPGAEPRYLIQVNHKGQWWRLAFLMTGPREAILLTCFRQKKRKIFPWGK